MDEQTRQQQQATYDVSADGAAYTGYEEESLPPTPEPEPELAPEGEGVSDDELVKFFGDLPVSEPETPPDEAPKADAPNWYTDDELKNTPFEQWELSRLNGDVGKFAPIVQEQLKQRVIQQQTQAMQSAPLPAGIAEVKAYTAKELSEAAMKKACESLGLEDADDFDSYEADHVSALEIARNELLQQRNAEIAGYQNAVQSWQVHQQFMSELMRQPDFNEFDQWYIAKCQEKGVTPQQVNEALITRARNAGNRFDTIAQTVGGWYQEFRQGKTQTSQPPIRRATNKAPAVLESSRGNNNVGIRRIRPQDFGDMTPDEQAKALIQMGYV